MCSTQSHLGPATALMRQAGRKRGKRLRGFGQASISLLALSVALISSHAHADDWLGFSSDWFDTANWSGGTLPDNASNLAIDGTENDPVVTGGVIVDIHSVYVGDGAQLSVTNGAQFTASNGIFTGYNANEYGLITASGAGTMIVAGAGTTIAEHGTGELIISDQAQLFSSAGELQVGYGSGSTGIVLVTGTGTQWLAADVTAGVNGKGIVTLSDGASAQISDLIVGQLTGSDGQFVVNGSSLSISIGGSVSVGRESTGSLLVSNGGTVSSAGAVPLTVGLLSGGVGTVTISGTGSGVTTGALTVGGAGKGTVYVENGGTLNSTNSLIGSDLTGEGHVFVSGSGSSWNEATAIMVGFSGDGYVVVNNDGVLDVDNGSGTIQLGSGANSTGVLIIGGIDINTAEAGGTVNADTIYITDQGSLAFNHTDDYYEVSTSLTGTGDITQVAGTTVITSAGNPFAGETTIWGGKLVVNGDLGGTLNVVNLGTLGGTGSVGAVTAAAGGTIAPGNSIGTLNVTDATFETNGILLIELESGGTSDILAASGTVTINGGEVQFVPYPDYALGTSYTFITATGGVTGTFDSADFTGSIFITPTLTYNANDVSVVLNKTKTFDSVALTPNQKAAGIAAEALGAGASVYEGVLASTTLDEALYALDHLSGEVYPSMQSMQIENTGRIRSVAAQRLRSPDAAGTEMAALGYAGPVRTRPEPFSVRPNLWMKTTGAWGELSSDGNAAALTHATGEIMIGADTEFAPGWRGGLLAAYGRDGVEVSDRSSSGDSNSYTIGSYFGHERDAMRFQLGGSFSWHDMTSSRSLAFGGFTDDLTGATTGMSGQAFASLGYALDTQYGVIEPFGDAALVYQHMNSFTEAGGAAALSVSPDDALLGVTTIGVKASRDLGMVSERPVFADASIGWRHVFGDNTPQSNMHFAGGSDFVIAGAPVAPDAVLVDLDLSMQVSAQMDMSFGLSGSYSTAGLHQAATLGLTGSF